MDVNVHPTKQEVKFGSDKKVFDAVYYAVKSTLEADRTRPSSRWSPRARRRGGLRSLPSARRSPLRRPHYRGDDLEEFRRTAERPAAALPLHDFTAPGQAALHPLPGTASPAPTSTTQPAAGWPPISAGRSRHLSPSVGHLRPNLRRAARANGRPCPPG